MISQEGSLVNGEEALSSIVNTGFLDGAGKRFEGEMKTPFPGIKRPVSVVNTGFLDGAVDET